MSFTRLDGSKLAETVRAEVRAEVLAFVAEHGRPPGLEVVLVGEDFRFGHKQAGSPRTTEITRQRSVRTLPTIGIS